MRSLWVWMPQCSEWVSAAKLISTLWTNSRDLTASSLLKCVCVSISDTRMHTPLPQMTPFQGAYRVTICSHRAPSAAWKGLWGASAGTEALLHGEIYANREVVEVGVGGRRRRLLPVNLRQEYGHENVLSTLTQVPIKNPVLPPQCVSLH